MMTETVQGLLDFPFTTVVTMLPSDLLPFDARAGSAEFAC